MRKGIPVGLMAMLLAVPIVSSAQDVQPVEGAPAQNAPPQEPAVQSTPAPSAPASGAAARSAPEGRRHSIRMMEAVLSRAVLTGAEHLAEQLGSGNPNMSFFTGQARARGFVLDGYGVFFHVEIPEMNLSMVWSVTTLERDVQMANSLEALKRFVDSVPDGPEKLLAEQNLKRLQIQVGPPPVLADPDAVGSRGKVYAAADRTAAAAAPVPDVPMPILKDPSGAYREAIKDALIDAMLEHSRGMNLGPDEWLSVAAHRGDSPMSPNEIVTSPTLILRVKGSDLALYDADRSRKDEVRKRVEAREF